MGQNVHGFYRNTFLQGEIFVDGNFSDDHAHQKLQVSPTFTSISSICMCEIEREAWGYVSLTDEALMPGYYEYHGIWVISHGEELSCMKDTGSPYDPWPHRW